MKQAFEALNIVGNTYYRASFYAIYFDARGRAFIYNL